MIPDQGKELIALCSTMGLGAGIGVAPLIFIGGLIDGYSVAMSLLIAVGTPVIMVITGVWVAVTVVLMDFLAELAGL